MADQHTGDSISANVTGPVQGQVAVGKSISQSQAVGTMAGVVTEAERAELKQVFADARTQVAAQAPPQLQQAAVEHVDELEQAVTAEKPDLTTMQYVKGWFSKNLPHLAGSIVGLVVHPIVGKLVEAGGEMAAGQLRELFGAE